jgi:hypothetical protein
MANVKAVQLDHNGALIMIWFNDANNRVGNIEWSIPAGKSLMPECGIQGRSLLIWTLWVTTPLMCRETIQW